MSASQPLTPSCPSGGQFFACTTGSLFVGCCESNDACATAGCAAGNIKPASFNSQAAGHYPDQSCPAGAQWYTCADQNPPFMGCCKSNPCSSSGCPNHDLAAGILNTVNDVGYVTGSMTNSPSTASSPTGSAATTVESNPLQNATTTTAAGSAGFLPIASPTAAAASGTPMPQSASLSGGAIAGIVIGAFVGVLGLAALAALCCRRHTRLSRRAHSPSELLSPSYQPEAVSYPQSAVMASPGTSYTSQATTLQPSSVSALVPAANHQPYRNNYSSHLPELEPEHPSPFHTAGAMSPSSLRSGRSYASQIQTPVSRFSFARSRQEQLATLSMNAAELPG